jgi:cytochrome P450
MTTMETAELSAQKEHAVRARPPGPPPRQAGLLGRIKYGLNFLLDPLGFVGGRFARYGDVYFVGAERDSAPGLFVLRHPDHIEQVLITDARKMRKTHSAFANLSQVLGDGLLTTDGEVWRRQRRLVQPAFSRARLEGYARAMGEEARAEADRWKAGETRDICVDMMEMTLRIVSRTLFGHDSSGDAESVRRSMAAFQSSLLGAGLGIPRWISPAEWRISRATAALDEIIYRIIRERRTSRGTDVDLLQMLLDAVDEEGDGGGLSEREIRDQIVTLFLAGHETTANALSWTFYLLSQHPEIEARLHEEVDRVLAGRAADFGDVARLPYAEQVFLEAMRLYPPVYVIARQAAEALDIGGFHVPAGSEIVLWVWHVHRDPRWFDEPWAFRPERFERARIAERPKNSYLPFGAGPRACIGKSFAQIEGQLALATIAARHHLELAPDHPVELSPRITLAPSKGLKMIVHARHGA